MGGIGVGKSITVKELSNELNINFICIDSQEFSNYYSINNIYNGENSLYNRLKLTTQVSKKRKVYSCNLENDIKNIRNIEIKNYQIEFNKKYKQTIEMFEVLQNFNKIEDLNYKSFYEYAREYTNVYNEKIVDQVIKTMKYKKSTISFLNNILDYFNVDNNLNKYLSSLSKYNHKTMEEIYEFTQTQERF